MELEYRKELDLDQNVYLEIRVESSTLLVGLHGIRIQRRKEGRSKCPRSNGPTTAGPTLNLRIHAWKLVL